MSSSTTSRTLPARPNPHMTNDEKLPEFSTLVRRRGLGQTPLKSSNDADSDPSILMFDYLHLRVPMPKGVVSGVFKSSSSSYFLMRRSSDGFVSATGMFKAAFPWATVVEHEAETKYFRELGGTSAEETAGNVWVMPVQALRLADDYNIAFWIRALLDPARLTGDRAISHGNPIKQPPKFNMADLNKEHTDKEQKLPKSQLTMDKPRLAPPTPPSSFHQPTTRSRRSLSPTKATRRKEVAPSPRKRASARIRAQSKERREPSREPSEEGEEPHFQDDDSVSDMASTADPEESVRESMHSLPPHDLPIATIEEEEEDTKIAIKASSSVVGDDEEVQATVHVKEEIRYDEITGEETKHTKVELELPLLTAGVPPSQDEMQQMLEQARAMVDGLGEFEDAPETPMRPSRGKTSKRKVDLISKGDDEEEAEAIDKARENTEGEEDRGERRAKRVKVEAAAAVQVKKRRVRNRALFGIGATVAVGALIPWALNFL